LLDAREVSFVHKNVIRGVFVGLSTIDLVYEVDEFPSPDSKVTARSQVIYAGGPATNAAITFRHLGGEAALVTAVGRHPLTALIREELNACGVKLLDRSPDWVEVSAISAVAVNPVGQRNVISANAGRVSEYSDRVDPELLESASVLLVDGHLMKACLAWARAAEERGIPVVLDGGSWKPGTELLLPYIEAAICSSDFRPPGCFGSEQVIQFLRDCGVRQIAITAGSSPIQFASEQGSGCSPVPEVSAVDTMGAGDIFHGAYAYFVAAGLSFPDALARAADIASGSCRFRGPRAWINR
jgi:sugar/nucleoside kinase (ribokinase family)